jgi:hypothetical protein
VEKRSVGKRGAHPPPGSHSIPGTVTNSIARFGLCCGIPTRTFGNEPTEYATGGTLDYECYASLQRLGLDPRSWDGHGAHDTGQTHGYRSLAIASPAHSPGDETALCCSTRARGARGSHWRLGLAGGREATTAFHAHRAGTALSHAPGRAAAGRATRSGAAHGLWARRRRRAQPAVQQPSSDWRRPHDATHCSRFDLAARAER